MSNLEPRPELFSPDLITWRETSFCRWVVERTFHFEVIMHNVRFRLMAGLAGATLCLFAAASYGQNPNTTTGTTPPTGTNAGTTTLGAQPGTATGTANTQATPDAGTTTTGTVTG